MRHLVLAMGLANGLLFSCALPLWEGFDEPVHYGYVESVSLAQRLPVLRQTTVSQEIRDSLQMTPLSRLLSASVPGSISFEGWTALGDAEKRRRMNALFHIPAAARREPSNFLNYEAQQAPLAYMLYAPFDRMLGGLALPSRILVLRLGGTIISCFILYFALMRLLYLLNVHGPLQLAVLACVFETEMIWAAIAHVGNDAFAIPVTAWFLASLAWTVKEPTSRNVLLLSSVFALGLVSKAYFLSFVPVFGALLIWLLLHRTVRWTAITVGVLIVLTLSGPWYGRNLALYGSLSGTQQSVAGVGWREAFAAIPHIDWLQSNAEFARWSLWTGNWSFLSFSRFTLALEIWLLRAALIVYLVFWRCIQKMEIWLWAACGCFALSLIYQTCVTWASSQGVSRFAEPWYAQGVIVCIWALCFTGLARWSKGGRWIAAALVLVSSWIAAATYFAKLLPYYGGGLNRSNFGVLWHWWTSHPTQDLATVTLAPVLLVYQMLALFSALLVLSAVIILRQLLARS